MEIIRFNVSKYQDCSTINQIIDELSSDVTLKFKNKPKYEDY